MPKYSFIVPVYNVENYIEECLKSLLCQTYKDFEVIVVDDGATDRSYEKCATIAAKDHRVKIIRQRNEGLGEARNAGIRNSSGQYLIFVDGDDFWTSEEDLYKIDLAISSERSEVLCFNFVLFDNNTQTAYKITGKNRKRIHKQSQNRRIIMMITSDLYKLSACNKIVLASLIRDNEIYFNKGLSEDIDWAARVLMCSKNISYLDEAVYAYRKNRTGSITDTVKRKYLYTYIEILDRISTYKEKYNFNQVVIDYYNATIYRGVIVSYIKSEKKDEFIRNKLIEYRFLIKYLTGFKMLIFKIANLFSIDLFLKILKK